MSSLNFAMPFGFDKLGRVATTTDIRRIWQNRVILAVTTRFGERLMIPDFGGNLDRSLFEVPAAAMEIAVKSVNISFNKWLTELKLIDVIPDYDPTSGFMTVSIKYTLPSGDVDSVAVNTAIFSRSGDIIQEISRG